MPHDYSTRSRIDFGSVSRGPFVRMQPNRPIVRLMAAMILAIIAYLAPSAVQAHEGHGHHGAHHPVAVTNTVAPAKAASPVPAAQTVQIGVRAAKPHWARVALRTSSVALESVRSDDADDCCPRGCRTRCCGSMTCCTSAVLGTPASLPVRLGAAVVVIPFDVSVPEGLGPEALPKPPRTRA
jgi:hypothetical protein